jgi:dTDP-4-dehydrorhamnose reductase
MSNILVTGCDGQLGLQLRELSENYPNYHMVFTDISKLDLTEHGTVKRYFKENDFDFVINCAAYTSVDKAEAEPYKANDVNHLAVDNLARICKDRNIGLIHISTDYVFDGSSDIPYTETDKPNPHSVYGKTKLEGELSFKAINPMRSLIIRTSWLYSKFGNNFVSSMISRAKENKQICVVNDQIGSPTSAFELAKVILDIIPKIDNKDVEVFHFSSIGECSWFDFAKEIFRRSDLDVDLQSISSADFSSLAPRPNYSALNCEKIKNRFDISILDWKTSFNKIDFSSLAVEA